MIEQYISKLITEREIIDVITIKNINALLAEELNKIRNLKNFCREQSLCYNNIVDIKNGNASKYPLLVKQLLMILCTTETEEIKIYQIITRKRTDET